MTNRMKAILFCCMIALQLVITGCAMVIDHQYQRYLPRRPNWKLKTNNPDPNQLIRYDCIYVNEFYDPYFPKYVIKRFWPTGQFMSKFANDYTDKDVINSFTNIAVGYYKLEGNTLIRESFGPLNWGQYGYSVSKIDEEGNIITKSHGPSLRTQRSYSEPRVYFPFEVDLRDLQPDW
jgi:hypothetical protein